MARVSLLIWHVPRETLVKDTNWRIQMCRFNPDFQLATGMMCVASYGNDVNSQLMDMMWTTSWWKWCEPPADGNDVNRQLIEMMWTASWRKSCEQPVDGNDVRGQLMEMMCAAQARQWKSRTLVIKISFFDTPPNKWLDMKNLEMVFLRLCYHNTNMKYTRSTWLLIFSHQWVYYWDVIETQ